MVRWPWRTNSEDEKVHAALATERAAHGELLDVITELESLVARLYGLPETRPPRIQTQRSTTDRRNQTHE